MFFLYMYLTNTVTMHFYFAIFLGSIICCCCIVCNYFTAPPVKSIFVVVVVHMQIKLIIQPFSAKTRKSHSAKRMEGAGNEWNEKSKSKISVLNYVSIELEITNVKVHFQNKRYEWFLIAIEDKMLVGHKIIRSVNMFRAPSKLYPIWEGI